MFYDIRRPVLRQRQMKGWGDLAELALQMQERWIVLFHYELLGTDDGERTIMLVTFISKLFVERAITKDILQLDDIDCTNIDHAPIVNVALMDENNKAELLAFGIMANEKRQLPRCF